MTSTMKTFSGRPSFTKMILAAITIFFTYGIGSVAGLSGQVWELDLATFAWPFLVVLAFILLAGSLRFGGTISNVAAFIGVVFAVMPIFCQPEGAAATTSRGIRLMTANLYMQNASDPSGSVRYVREQNPDILVLQEATYPWQKALIDSGMFPYESDRNLEARVEMKVFSKRRVVSEDQLRYSPEAVGKSRTPLRVELEGTKGKPVVLYAVHPESPRSRQQWHDRNDYLRAVADAARLDGRESTVIVAGDWNASTWSPIFREFFRSSGLTLAKEGWLPHITRFSLRLDPVVRVGTTIDHMAVSKDLAVSDWATGPAFGSNHLPVVVDVAYQ